MGWSPLWNPLSGWRRCTPVRAAQRMKHRHSRFLRGGCRRRPLRLLTIIEHRYWGCQPHRSRAPRSRRRRRSVTRQTVQCGKTTCPIGGVVDAAEQAAGIAGKIGRQPVDAAVVAVRRMVGRPPDEVVVDAGEPQRVLFEKGMAAEEYELVHHRWKNRNRRFA